MAAAESWGLRDEVRHDRFLAKSERRSDKGSA